PLLAHLAPRALEGGRGERLAVGDVGGEETGAVHLRRADWDAGGIDDRDRDADVHAAGLLQAGFQQPQALLQGQVISHRSLLASSVPGGAPGRPRPARAPYDTAAPRRSTSCGDRSLAAYWRCALPTEHREGFEYAVRCFSIATG